jgi:hypothetical protein
MKVEFYFPKKAVQKMDLTLEFTATLEQWEEIKKAINREKDSERLTPMENCISQMISAVNDSTGHGYRSKGYQYNYDTMETEECAS